MLYPWWNNSNVEATYRKFQRHFGRGLLRGRESLLRGLPSSLRVLYFNSTMASAPRAASAKKTRALKKTVSKKKPTTKATKPKSAVKKRTVTPKGRVLVCADGQECFWTTDGQILKDLTELRDALTKMSEEVFSFHVTRERNDFADWVEQVLKDASCAAALRKSRKPKTARTVVVRHLKLYRL